jgi:hypothetical protein
MIWVKLTTERLITCSQTAPAWVLAVLGSSPISHVLETSTVDPSSKRVTMTSTNLSWSNILSVQETVVYEPERLLSSKKSSTSDSLDGEQEKTRFKQEAKITALCGGWQKIRTKIEEASVERFGENARRGREGFEAVLEMSRRVFGEEKERERQRL